ncbi:neurofascin-like [Haliotis rufescens]|uniref:neurofascin-like n=1 Tax=Haliotis rufescens TaxID=6454 RepID=UPI00201E7986|nr:neurofascin-like [Haliotis rufescens]
MLIWAVLVIINGLAAATSPPQGGQSLLMPQNITEGTPVSLPCRLSGRINWFRGAKQIIGDPRRQMDRHGNLHFSYVDVSDTAVYKCSRASNSKVKLVNPVHLNVIKAAGKVKDAMPKLQYSSGTTHVTLGQDVTQQCIFSGRPVPVVTWYHDDNQITETARVKLSFTSVTIKNMSEEDTGTYRCIGKNTVTSNSHVVNLTLPVQPNAELSTTPAEQNDDTTAGKICIF